MIELLIALLIFFVIIHSIILTAAFFTLRQEIEEIYDAIADRVTHLDHNRLEVYIDQAHRRISDLAISPVSSD